MTALLKFHGDNEFNLFFFALQIVLFITVFHRHNDQTFIMKTTSFK